MNSEDDFLGRLYQRFPIVIERGKGAKVWDTAGKEYIDCMAGYGVALVGHCNDRVVNAIKDQIDKLMVCHMSTYNTSRANMLNKLSKIAPKGLDRFFFSNSGAEAVETALKFSRKFSGKPGVISMNGGYHGKTLGALSITSSEKYRKPFEPLLDYIKFVPYGNTTKLIDSIDDKTGTVILEPIQGESGIILPPPGFIQEVREICSRNSLVLIFDEIQSGFGRTGKMWAAENWNTIPDVICVAKGIAGGFPMGLTITKTEIMESMKIGEHSSTFAGNPLACVAANASIDALLLDGLIENSAETGQYFKDLLLGLKEKHKIVREVRGLGMMLALELRFDVRNILMDGISNGILMLYSGRNIIRLLPPLVIDRELVLRFVTTLDRLLSLEEEKRSV
ncbi:MAG TPA: aspartate aminotransferase family protein [Nitrososphaeraceae archaeon]|jgi:acetylornithine/LysW-gamma-L-lysine aminotransferase|nr:aspartate aminotransferase family protein [Nitrososphaeraceae archaeon]